MPIRFDISSGPQSQAEQQTDLWALLTIPLSRFQHPLSSQTLLCISTLDIAEEDKLNWAYIEHWTRKNTTLYVCLVNSALQIEQIRSKGCWVFWDVLKHMIFETFPSDYCSLGTSQSKNPNRDSQLRLHKCKHGGVYKTEQKWSKRR